MLEPEVETRPWAQQLSLDGASYRAQLAYLFERSDFYREKLTAAGFASASAAGGLEDLAELPLTEKDELRAAQTADNPIGSHLCATPSEIVRIYSTSGTTGTPSYVPLTAGDLDVPRRRCSRRPTLPTSSKLRRSEASISGGRASSASSSPASPAAASPLSARGSRRGGERR
jgi:phenylacetate-CoA ligase